MAYATQSRYGELAVSYSPKAAFGGGFSPGTTGMWQGPGRDFSRDTKGLPSDHNWRAVAAGAGGTSSVGGPVAPKQFRHPQVSRESLMRQGVDQAARNGSRAWLERQASLQRAFRKQRVEDQYVISAPISASTPELGRSQSLPTVAVPLAGGVFAGERVRSMINFSRELSGETIKAGDVGTVIESDIDVPKGRVSVDFPGMRSVHLSLQQFKKHTERVPFDVRRSAAHSYRVYQEHGFLDGCGAVGITDGAGPMSGLRVRNRSGRAPLRDGTVPRALVGSSGVRSPATLRSGTRKPGQQWRAASTQGSFVFDPATALPAERSAEDFGPPSSSEAPSTGGALLSGSLAE